MSVVARSQASRDLAENGNADQIVTELNGLPPVDGIIVATPTASHADVIESVLDRGVPIFAEKPLTNNSGRARALNDIAGDRIFVMDKWRYHSGILALADIARNSELGPVLGLKTRRLGWGQPHLDVDCVWILMPHDLSIGLEILGYVLEPRCAVVERMGGAITGMTALLGTQPWHLVEIGVRLPRDRRAIELICRDGIVELEDSYSEYILITRHKRDISDLSPPESERREIVTDMPLMEELRAFVSHLEGGPPPRSTAAEGLRVIETIETLRKLGGID